MGLERFITSNVLPPELTDRIQRKVRLACQGVQDDPAQGCVVTVKFYIEANTYGIVNGKYGIEQKFADRTTHEWGEIRDGQMVLAGAGRRSDEAPEPEPGYQDDFLAAPSRR